MPGTWTVCSYMITCTGAHSHHACGYMFQMSHSATGFNVHSAGLQFSFGLLPPFCVPVPSWNGNVYSSHSYILEVCNFLISIVLTARVCPSLQGDSILGLLNNFRMVKTLGTLGNGLNAPCIINGQ